MTDDTGQQQLRHVAEALIDDLSGCGSILEHQVGVHHRQHTQFADRGRDLGLTVAASRLAHVRAVALEPSPSRLRVWTLIDAPEFDRTYRQPIYALQQKTLAGPESSIGFRLINLNELETEAAERVLPANAEVLYQRE